MLIVVIYRHMPGHASREILVILGSLVTCDPGDIHQTIKVEIMLLPSWSCSLYSIVPKGTRLFLLFLSINQFVGFNG